MKKNFFSIIAFLISIAFKGFSQDTIHKIDGSVLIGKISEVDNNEISYTVGNVRYHTNVNTIGYIVYSNGLREQYNMSRMKDPIVNNTSPEKFKKNVLAFNTFEVLFVDLSLSYERILADGKVGIKVPFSFGLGGPPDEQPYFNNVNGTLGTRTTFMKNKIFSSGIELNYYPFGQTRNTFYVGISGLAGSFYYYDYGASLYYPYNSYNPYIKVRRQGKQYAGMVHLGGYLGLSEHILIGAKVGLGFRREETIFVDYTQPKIQMDINLAYKF